MLLIKYTAAPTPGQERLAVRPIGGRAVVGMLIGHGGRVAGIENLAGTPVYVHAKACVVDDAWASIGSDNFNRRSWTHDSELSAVVADGDTTTDDPGDSYARRLRLTLAAEHLDRATGSRALEQVRDCVDPAGMFTAFEQSAARLDDWHDSGRAGPRPAGRLRRVQPPEMSALSRVLALGPTWRCTTRWAPRAAASY
jgi:phosphatidylserine/phosphatidylglycerophosphate/cardiolipin synthase-like enzyme